MRLAGRTIGHRKGHRTVAVALADRFARAARLATAGLFALATPYGVGLLVLAAPVAVDAAQADCGDGLPNATRALIETGALTLAFAPRPAPIAVGRHFAVDVVVCAAPGMPVPTLIRVDAEMPAHRHGMNYRAAIRPLGGDRYAADGLMFHMPGRWRFVFTLGGGRDVSTTLAHEIEVE